MAEQLQLSDKLYEWLFAEIAKQTRTGRINLPSIWKSSCRFCRDERQLGKSNLCARICQLKSSSEIGRPIPISEEFGGRIGGNRGGTKKTMSLNCHTFSICL
jgi:hypothetical protein